jgi:DnaJ-class molecular chaperone
MINHLDGHKVLVSAEGVLQNGHEIIIENEGMLYGNLIITVNINFPKQYNKKQLEQIGKIFETGDAKFSDEDL